MKKNLLLALIISASLGATHAATVVVTNADNGVSNIGAPGTFHWALTNVNDGDTIAFNIPGAGPHYLQVPPLGFPLLIKDRVTIDGYTQPGASANSNAITASNNAVIKIVLDSRSGNFRLMEYPLFTPLNVEPPIDNTSMALERGGYGDPERATLGIYRATNVVVRGIAFLGQFSPSAYGIAVAHDYGLNTNVLDRLAYNEGSSRNCHINGCWFGIDPTNQTVAGLAQYADAIAFFRHRDVSGGVRPELPNESLIVGVKAGSANPRAEFNVFAYMGLTIAGEGIRMRFSGNFVGVFPDGVTPTDVPPVFDGGLEIGRYDDTQPIITGTDGDGVNDADEGNLFGPIQNGDAYIGYYSAGNKLFLFSGNRFGIAVNGTRWTNAATFWDGLSSAASMQFGSDLNGVGDAAEANVVYNNYPGFSGPPDRFFVPAAGARLSMRGNTLVNNGLLPFDYVDANGFTNYSRFYMDTNGPIVPSLSAGSTAGDIIGQCALTNGGSYSNIIIDVYTLDPEGWTNGIALALPELNVTNGFPQGRTYLGSFVDNGPADRNPAVASFNFGAGSLGLTAGTQITVTANYSADPPGTTWGRVFTSDFSMPVTLLQPVRITSITRSGSVLTINWTGGAAPYTLQTANPITGAWSNVTTGIAGTSTTANITGTQGYYRVLGN